MIRFDIVEDGGSINYNYPAAQFYFMDINHTSAVLNPPKLIDNRKDAYIPVYFIYPNNQNPDYYRYTIATILFIRHNVFNEIRNASSSIYSMIGSGIGNDSVFPCVYISNSVDMVHKELNIDRDKKDALFTELNILYSVDTFIDGYKNTIFSNLLSKEAIKAKLKNNCFIVDVVNTPFISDSMKNNNFMYGFGNYQSYLKNLSFVIRGDIIPGYMLSKPTTNPSADYKGYLEKQVTALQNGKLVELLPDNPIKENMFNYSIRLKKVVNRYNSEYIRRSYSKEQKVATDLNFTGKVKVPTPVNANDASTKDYVDSQKSQIINDIATQNPTLEKLHKIEWALEPLIWSTGDTVTYSPGLSFCQFLDDKQMPLQLVAFSLDEDAKITNFNNSYLMGKYWTVYFAPTTTNNLASAKWTVKEARQMLKTLTPEDGDYLNAYDYIIKMKVQVDNVGSYNYIPISIFNHKAVLVPSTAASTATAGINLWQNGGVQVRIWIDDEDSLNLFKLHIKNMIFSTYLYAGGASYGTLRVRVSSILNDKYVDFNHVFNQYTQDKKITNSSTASRAYMVSLNLVRDSTYNKKTISPSITGLLLNNKTPILYWREWDDDSQGFVFRERTYAEANADVPT